MKFKTIFIANRGEIARRVIRTAHECGYTASAAYSPHDRNALFVRESDKVFPLAGNAPNASYLDIEQVLRAAKTAKADAIHPGYGFLSENAEFSAACAKADIKFIGPEPEAIDLLGDKTKARALAGRLGVPTPSGTTEALTSDREAIETGKKVGYPILLKAAAGGGGKGMRVVNQESELLENLARARGEALNAFGDDRVYVEKYITKPRHIEIQVLGDSHGKVVYLGERECSIQRRHQKVIEEAPSPIMTEKLRKEMGEAAVSLVKNAKYEGAGTVEFLVDENGKYYFLEVNTRLQVEHPVTEFITGLDLVREQFRIAEGEKLPFKQADVQLRGHAIEVRVQAEDVWNDFLPSLGTLSYVRHPGGAFVRNDSAMFKGLEVSGHYDSLLSKLVVWDLDRASAIRRMLRALREMRIAGVSTTTPFAIFALENERFQKGELSTAFIPEEFTPEIRDAFMNKMIEERAPHFVAAQKHVDLARQKRLFVSGEKKVLN